MKKMISLFAISFSLNCLASEQLFCSAGLKMKNVTQSIEFIGSNSQEMKTNLGIIHFDVEEGNDGHIFRAINLDSEELYFEESIKNLPSKKSFKTQNGEEIFIECRPYKIQDYCRIYTC